ncbi:MAG: hypothetical protein ACOYM1_11615 [Methylovulum sp.]
MSIETNLIKHTNRALTAEDVKKASKVVVQVQTSEFNTGFCYVSYFEISKDNLIQDLTKFKSMSQYSNWCFSLNIESKDNSYAQNDFLEIPDGYNDEIQIIIGQMNR